MEHLVKLNAAARLSLLSFPPTPFTSELEDGVLYIKVYVVHLSVLKEVLVVRVFIVFFSLSWLVTYLKSLRKYFIFRHV